MEPWLISFFRNLVLEAHVVLCATEPIFFVFFCFFVFSLKMGKMGQKMFFFNILEILVINFFRIWFINWTASYEITLVCLFVCLLVKQAKIVSKISFFFLIFSSFLHQLAFIIALDDSLEQYLSTSRVKACKKKLVAKSGPNGSKSGPKLVFFCIFVKFGPLVFLQIA